MLTVPDPFSRFLRVGSGYARLGSVADPESGERGVPIYGVRESSRANETHLHYVYSVARSTSKSTDFCSQHISLDG